MQLSNCDWLRDKELHCAAKIIEININIVLGDFYTIYIGLCNIV